LGWYTAHVSISLFTPFGSEAVANSVASSLEKIGKITEFFIGPRESPICRKVASHVLTFLVIQSTNLYNVSRLIIMVSSLSLVAMGKEFEASVKIEGSLKNVIQRFETLRAAVHNTNEVTSGIMLAQYLSILTLLANSTSLRKGDSSWIEKYYITILYVMFGVFLVVACDLPKRVRYINRSMIIQLI